MLRVAQFYRNFVSPVVRNGIPVLALLGFWAGLWRAGLIARARMAGIIVTAVLLVWWVANQLGQAGFSSHCGSSRAR